MRIILIFVLIVSSYYELNTNLKNLQYKCNAFQKIAIDDPLVLGNFNIMKLIPLSTTGKKHAGKYSAMVDDEDYEFLSKHNWSVRLNVRKTTTVYAYRKSKKSEGRPIRTIFMHTEIVKVPSNKFVVDHKDRDGLNNQKLNLRIATLSQNSGNRISTYNSESKYLGVSYKRSGKRIKRWRARYKDIFLGHFLTEEEAARAYDKKAIEVYGEFANLNFKEDDIKS